jgi:hypothetical protein
MSYKRALRASHLPPAPLRPRRGAWHDDGMAKVKSDVTMKFVTTKDGDVEDTQFKAGDEVHVVKEWQSHYLVRGADGHYYTFTKNLIDK